MSPGKPATANAVVLSCGPVMGLPPSRQMILPLCSVGSLAVLGHLRLFMDKPFRLESPMPIRVNTPKGLLPKRAMDLLSAATTFGVERYAASFPG